MRRGGDRSIEVADEGRRPSFSGFLSWLLRPYQQNALHALFAYWRSGGGNPLLAMATGTGKRW